MNDAMKRAAAGNERLRAQCALLLDALDRGDDAAATPALAELTRVAEGRLWDGLQRVSCDLQAQLQQIPLDPGLMRLARDEIPDACTRLEHVVRVTEEAAHRTLDLVESSRGEAVKLRAQADALDAARARARECADPAAALGRLLSESAFVLAEVRRGADAVCGNLSEVALAQGFQDLTGQIIKRVTKIVRRLESSLADLLGGVPASAVAANDDIRPKELPGPAVPGDEAASQSEADDLLTQLGL